jgi:transaldolase
MNTHTPHAVNPRTQALQKLGQSLWLDNITRALLDSGTLERYIAGLSVTGLTSNPTIFERAISAGSGYDSSIQALNVQGLAGEDLFFELALQDLRRAADLFRPAFEASGGVDGWVSLEVSPLLADNTAHTIHAASRLYERAARPNVFIKIPGTPEGLRAVEEVLFDGVPVNVTLLFSSEQYRAAAAAHLRALERRLAAGLHLQVASVASLFISRWDVAVQDAVAPEFRNRLGIAVAMQSYRAHSEWLQTDRWKRLAANGARPQRLLWASTGVKDPAAPDTLYVQALAAAGTINTLPEKTLLAWADHGQLDAGSDGTMPADGGYAEGVLQEHRREGINLDALALRLQREGVQAFALSWHALLACIREKCPAQAPGASGESGASASG